MLQRHWLLLTILCITRCYRTSAAPDRFRRNTAMAISLASVTMCEEAE
jgi:hypothetical protein